MFQHALAMNLKDEIQLQPGVQKTNSLPQQMQLLAPFLEILKKKKK